MESARQTFSPQVYSQACEWFAEFRGEGQDEGACQAFHAWLKAAPAHVAAYLEVAAVWQDSAALNVREKWPLERLVEEARTDTANVVPLGERAADREAANEGVTWHGRRRRMLAAAVAVAGVGVASVLWYQNRATTYATAVGEQRSFVLPDGSTVHLNARSVVRVRYSDTSRSVELAQGQALFNVEPDAARAFEVRSGAAGVRVLGTRFDVNRLRSGVTVSVLDGRVMLQSVAKPGAGAGIVLSAGEQGTAGTAGVDRVRGADVELAIARTQRELVFAGTPLADVAEMFNRYNARPLVIEDAALGDFRIDGVFSSTNPAALVRFLSDRPAMSVRTAADGIFIARGRDR